MTTLLGTSGADDIRIEATDVTYPTVTQILGAGGDDVITIAQDALRKMVVNGEAGNDQISGGRGNESLYGSSGNDVLLGRGGSDQIFGGSGNDIISGGNLLDSRSSPTSLIQPGRDAIYGGSGDDLLLVGDGDDWFFGGSGYDTLSFQSADLFNYVGVGRNGGEFYPLTTGATVDLSKGISTFGQWTHAIDSIENVIGSELSDTITGSKNANMLDGDGGNDTLRSLGGADTLSGGSGDDTFVYLKKDHADGSVDTITDFGDGLDVLDIRDFYKGHAGKAIDTMVHVTEVDGGSMVSIKANGVFIDVAMLDGITGLSAADMLADGMLLI